MSNNAFQKSTKYNKFIIIGIIIFFILPFISYRYLLYGVADYLIVQDKLSSADVIVVISGSGARYQYAIKLFKDGYGQYILFNYNKNDILNKVGVKFNPEEMINNLAVSNEVSLDRIFTDGRCTSTYEDALYTKENIMKNQFKSAIIVSNNFHMRRVYMTFKKVFKENNIKLTFAPLPMEMDGINPDSWWTREYELTTVFEEYVKLVFYSLKYGI